MVSLRPYVPADAPATRRVFESAVRGTASRHYTAEQIAAWCPETHDARAWQEARDRAWTMVAEHDGEVVGFSDLTADGVLDMLFVSPHASGLGVARRLVDAVVAEARRRHLPVVTTRASRAARPVFERFGWVVDGADPDNRIRGVAVPNFRMHLDLG